MVYRPLIGKQIRTPLAVEGHTNGTVLSCRERVRRYADTDGFKPGSPGRCHRVLRARLPGLAVTDLRTARCRMEFFDVGAVVWILRKCVWWVPHFSVERYQDKLAELDGIMRHEGPFAAHSTRHLIEAER